MRKIYVLVFLLGLLSVDSACAHAVHGALEEGAVGVRFFYDGGAPLRAAEIQVFGPNRDMLPIIQGETDLNGRFAFIPDQPGTWEIEVNDGMGHRAQFRIDVESTGIPATSEYASHGHHVAPWIVAISVLFGLFGIWALFFKRAGRPSSRVA